MSQVLNEALNQEIINQIFTDIYDWVTLKIEADARFFYPQNRVDLIPEHVKNAVVIILCRNIVSNYSNDYPEWDPDEWCEFFFESLDIHMPDLFEANVQEHVLRVAKKCDACIDTSSRSMQRMIGKLRAHFGNLINHQTHSLWCNEIDGGEDSQDSQESDNDPAN